LQAVAPYPISRMFRAYFNVRPAVLAGVAEPQAQQQEGAGREGHRMWARVQIGCAVVTMAALLLY
jgi:hypothetical protein